MPAAVWINPPVKKQKEETALLFPPANCPERPENVTLQNGLTDMKIEEIEDLQMVANLH